MSEVFIFVFGLAVTLLTIVGSYVYLRVRFQKIGENLSVYQKPSSRRTKPAASASVIERG